MKAWSGVFGGGPLMNIEVAMGKRLGDFHWHAEFSASGGRLGVFGPSGSGKSTLMNLLAGLLGRTRGGSVSTARRFSTAAINLAPEERRIGVVFQHAHLFPHLGVRRNLLYGYGRSPPNAGSNPRR